MRIQNKGKAPVSRSPAEAKPKRWGLKLTSGKRPETNPWTKGQALSTKAIALGCWAALVIWPLILVAVTGGFTPTAQAKPVKATQTASTVDQSAGSMAQAYIAAWLTATRNNSAGLDSYTDIGGISLPEKGFEYRNLAVASIGQKSSDGVVQVQIAAEVREDSKAKDGQVVSTWPQRYFQVRLRVTPEGIKPVGLPLVVTSPLLRPEVSSGYSQNVAAADPLAQSITSFLQTYLAGTGDITRYLAPGTAITAVSPAPFTGVKPLQFRASTPPVQAPQDGASIRTLTTVQLLGMEGQQLTAEYSLVLEARAGRWEVTELTPPDPAATAPTSTPSPTRK